MPQDSLRSAVYKSFVTCDNPKGVFECRTIRKSKTGSQKMKGNIENQNLSKTINRCFLFEEENKGVVSKMDVTRGAQKLNQVVESMSEGLSFNGHLTNNGNALLKGVLDVSGYVTSCKKKQKDGLVGKVDEVGIRRTNSDSFGCRNYQNARVSADGSSRDCYEELREAIRDGLARQNLLPNGCSEEKVYFDRNRRESFEDLPSTSSSRSSIAYSHDFSSSGSSVSSKVLEEKPKKVSNVIAKLMGLEEIPCKPLESTSAKELERDRILNQRRPIFDINMSKGRKAEVSAQNMERKHMILDEIINNMQFKGFLRRDEHNVFYSNSSALETRFSKSVPPVVLMKPTRPGVEADELSNKFIPEERALRFEKMSMAWRTKEEVSSKGFEHTEGALSSNMSSNLYLDETPAKKITKENVVKASRDKLHKSVDKEVKNKEKLSSTQMNVTVPVSSRLHEEVIGKNVDKVQRTSSRAKPLPMENVNSTSFSRIHEKPTSESSSHSRPRVSKIQEKPTIVSRSHEQHNVPAVKLRKSETESKVKNKGSISEQPTSQFRRDQPTSVSRIQEKPMSVSTSHEQLNVSAMKMRELETGSKVTKKNHLAEKKITMSKSVMKQSKPQGKSMKNVMPMEELSATNVGNVLHNDHDEQIDLKSKSNVIVENTSPAAESLAEEKLNASDILIKENCDNSPNPSREDTPMTIQHESPEEAVNFSNYNLACITRTTSNDRLSRSLSFLGHVEDLFDNIDEYQPMVLQALTSLHISGIVSSKLLMDCANELLESRSTRHIPSIHPLLQKPVENPRFCISVDHLMQEVRDGIEELIKSSNLVRESTPADAVFAVLERDLWCKAPNNGLRNMGWKDAFTGDEVEQIASDMDKLLLGDLIEEIISDFCH